MTRLRVPDTAHAIMCLGKYRLCVERCVEPTRRNVRADRATNMSASAVRDRARTTAMIPSQKWPRRLWIVRHGQSAGNVARDAAELAQQALIDLATRYVDTHLSELGKQQARALGK